MKAEVRIGLSLQPVRGALVAPENTPVFGRR